MDFLRKEDYSYFMSDACPHRLSNGEICGRKPMPHGYCDIHSTSLHNSPKDFVAALKRYVDETRADIIYMNDMTFPKGVTLEGDIFQNRQVMFCYSKFFNCIFDKCHFFDADFSSAKFLNTYFKLCQFNGKNLSFFNAEFNENHHSRIFDHCAFLDLDRIDLSQLKWACDQRPFASSYFSAKEIDFNSATIESSDFSIGLWAKDNQVFNVFHMILGNLDRLILSGIIFSGNFQFANWKQEYSYVPYLFYDNINFDQMKSAKFLDADLTKTTFENSIIEKIYFINPIWPKKNNRNILWNELTEPLIINNAELRRLYVQLKKNCEEKRDYDTASDWHYREMEARRNQIENKLKPLRWLRRELFSFIALYKLFSNYGESYIKPLIWLVALSLVSSLLFVKSGINGCNNYLCVLIYSLANMTFYKISDLSSASIYTDVISIFQKIFLTVLLSLFLLALRRRFRR